MRSLKIGAVSYKSRAKATRALLKNTKLSVSEIAIRVGTSVPAVSQINRAAGIRPVRQYTKKERILKDNYAIQNAVMNPNLITSV